MNLTYEYNSTHGAISEFRKDSFEMNKTRATRALQSHCLKIH